LSKLLLVRHGRTKLYKNDRFWGSTDVSLSDIGISQAERLRDRLANETINSVYTSTLSRTRLTAKIITSGRNLDIQEQEELCECNFGYAEGLTFDEITVQYPELAQVLRGLDTCAQFPGGESFNELDSRVKKFLEQMDNREDKGTILIVAHASPLKIMLCHMLGIAVENWRKFRFDLASLSIVETYPEGVIVCHLNDISHLKIQEVI